MSVLTFAAAGSAIEIPEDATEITFGEVSAPEIIVRSFGALSPLL